MLAAFHFSRTSRGCMHICRSVTSISYAYPDRDETQSQIPCARTRQQNGAHVKRSSSHTHCTAHEQSNGVRMRQSLLIVSRAHVAKFQACKFNLASRFQFPFSPAGGKRQRQRRRCRLRRAATALALGRRLRARAEQHSLNSRKTSKCDGFRNQMHIIARAQTSNDDADSLCVWCRSILCGFYICDDTPLYDIYIWARIRGGNKPCAALSVLMMSFPLGAPPITLG